MKRNATLAITITVAIIWTIFPTTQSVAEAPVIDIPVLTPKEYAQQELENRGYPSKNWECLLNLWEKESHWNPKADNPTSTAFGIAQRLGEKSTDPITQINNGLKYIEYRYGSPCNAWLAWKARDAKGIGWY